MMKAELSKKIRIKIVIEHTVYIVLERIYYIFNVQIDKDFNFLVDIRLLCLESILLLWKTQYYEWPPFLTIDGDLILPNTYIYSVEDAHNMNQGMSDDINTNQALFDLPENQNNKNKRCSLLREDKLNEFTHTQDLQS